MTDHRNFLVGAITLMVVVIALVVMVLLMVIPSMDYSNRQNIARIHACSHAANVTDCLKLNT